MGRGFRVAPWQNKKLKLHGLWDEWQTRRKAVAANKGINYAEKVAEYQLILDELMERIKDIEAGSLMPTEGSEYAAKPEAALELETQKGAAPTIEDCMWAFQNQGVENCDLTTAPSQGAIALKIRAERDTNIYKWLLDKTTPRSLVDNDDEVDTRALDLTDIETTILDKWQRWQDFITTDVKK